MSDSVPPRDADIAARLTADYRSSGLLVAMPVQYAGCT